jgi:hypothetical protein
MASPLSSRTQSSRGASPLDPPPPRNPLKKPKVRFRGHRQSFIALPSPELFLLRQEVAFERWFRNYGREDVEASRCTKRLWAVVALAEGVLKTMVEAVAYVVTVVADVFLPLNHNGNSDQGIFHYERHLQVLKAQAKGVYLSAMAIYDPEAVVEKVNDYVSDHPDEPLIGCFAKDLTWGTIYQGSLTHWSLDCCCDTWNASLKV